MAERSKRTSTDSFLDHVSDSSRGSQSEEGVQEFEFGDKVIEGKLLEVGLLNKM